MARRTRSRAGMTRVSLTTTRSPGTQQVRQVADVAVRRRLGGTGVDQESRRVARLDRRLGDGGRWQVVVEVRQPHPDRVRSAAMATASATPSRVAALQKLRSLPEVTGGTGVLGFCLGTVTCPVIFHFGDDDPYLPNEQVDAIRASVGDRPDVEIHVQAGAGHAFDNHEAPMFWNEAAAAAAWERTVAFLQQHLPVS